MRKTWLDFPLIGFDLETTGVDVARDRIVSAAVVRYGGGQTTETRTWLSNLDGVEIPAEATRIHGITTAQAQAEGRPAADVIQEITSALAAYCDVGLPLVVMNAPFDLTLLERECERHGVKSLWNSTPVVLDPRVLDKKVQKYRKGKRRLQDLCSFWCVKLDGAHNAAVDAKAACGVVTKIARRYSWLTREELGELHELQARWAREQNAEFREYLASIGGEVDDSPFDWPLLPVSASTA
ncbi:exonuclease domain-containing protein [Streptomyces griseofuscus]|uniref:exonuclease domain-containing protein n=1 Tax=Streptomyces griseofuscus TaxID=146922 RepID=UPI0033E59A22